MTQNGHSASAIVVSCIDPRLVRKLPDEIEETFGIAVYYGISLKGGAKCLLEDKSWDIALANIGLAVKGGARTIVLLTHADCAAYRAAGIQFSCKEGEKERAFHKHELQTAEAVVRSHFSSVKIISGFVFSEPVGLRIEQIVSDKPSLSPASA